ncbi:hypothetical protein C9374_003113 [Naegleria lovaniensis]|uniref:DOC domain-containing protein n=1 Tax=Naegleria lovaniensis TaxID=51637 RepID=A0AA88GTQ7_NAELO|nr:uncharacterized protein C9374_003113 [Naegleria lovaniensis]KAG2385964.1 hypothetical protein C9374_003113 [Naegleria lovaniensis]
MIQNVNHYQQPIDASFATYSSMIEIGKYAVWSVSTAKQGNGVEQLRDDNCETFWQSDGPQPHYINIQFHKVLSVQDVLIYLDYKKDESYTPQTISIRCGTSFHDLTHVKTVELEEPVGYICINMNDEKDQVSNCIRCNMLQIVISQNHLNGRDTHVRQVKVYGPIELKASSGAGVVAGVVAGVGGSGTGVGGIGGIGVGRTSAMTNHNNSSLVSNNDILNGGTVASSMIDSSNTIQFSMFSTLR